jgi:hypothetical protein
MLRDRSEFQSVCKRLDYARKYRPNSEGDVFQKYLILEMLEEPEIRCYGLLQKLFHGFIISEAQPFF